MSGRLLDAYRAAEAELPAVDEAALQRLPPRQREILRAMAALDSGERVRVLAAAVAARAAGEREVAWLLEQLMIPPPQPREVKQQQPAPPGSGETADVLRAFATWRSGKAARGSAELRRLAARRPVLNGLLTVLGRRKEVRWSPDGIARLSPRAPAVMVAAAASPPGSRVDVVGTVRKACPTVPIDLTRYDFMPRALDRIPALRQWIDDPRLAWGEAQELGVGLLIATNLRAQIPEFLRDLILAVHRRLAAGQASGLLEPVRVCGELAERIDNTALARELSVLERRLGGLFAPEHHLPALLTLWRRCVDLPREQRLAVAEKVIDALSALVMDRAEPPAELPFAIEALVFLIVHGEDRERSNRLVERFGWLLPEPKLAEVLGKVDPSARAHVDFTKALARGDLGRALDSLVALARSQECAEQVGELLIGVLGLLAFKAPPHVRRQIEGSLAALATTSLRLPLDVVLALLTATRDSDVGVEPARALARQALSQPLADGDPGLAERVLALSLLGDEDGARELVRRLGRWLRTAPPDMGDEVALAVAARVYDRQELFDDFAPLLELLAPLDAFILRAGPERPLKAAMRSRAFDSEYVRGYGAWARAHADRLGSAAFWRTLVARADQLEREDDADDAVPPEIPY